MQAGGLATQSVDVLHEYASLLRGSTRPSRDATGGDPLRFCCNGSNATNRHEYCGLSGVVAKGVAPLKAWAASRRTWDDSGCSVIIGGAAEVGEANEGSAQ